jgi:hypothetical protein
MLMPPLKINVHGNADRYTLSLNANCFTGDTTAAVPTPNISSSFKKSSEN